jgi:hypothetical protein
MLANILVALFAVIIGIVFCFWGYRFFLVMLPIWGFFAGLWLGAMGVSLLLGEGFLATVTGLVAGIILGLVGALLSYLFYMAGVVLIAAVVGGALGSAIMTAIGFDPGFIVTLVAILSAITVVILALVFNLQKYVIIVLTAISGADLIVLSGLLLFGRVSLSDLQQNTNLFRPITQESWLGIIIWLALAIAGLVLQVRSNRDFTFSKDRYVEAWG